MFSFVPINVAIVLLINIEGFVSCVSKFKISMRVSSSYSHFNVNKFLAWFMNYPLSVVTLPTQWIEHKIRKHCMNDDDISIAISWTVMRNSNRISQYKLKWTALKRKTTFYLFKSVFLDLKANKCDVAFGFNFNRICLYLLFFLYPFGFGRFSVFE